MAEGAIREGSRREQAKGERRSRIVDATYDLLREVGMEDLSVKMIADRADVSPATVYNLFKTKAAVLEKVNEIDLLSFEARVSKSSADALDRIFEAVTKTAQLYREDPGFYRAMNWTRDVSPDDDPSIAPYRPSEAFWCGLVRSAIVEGFLTSDTDAGRVGVVLMQIVAGSFFHWVSNIISVDQMERETNYAFAVVLSAFATKSTYLRLQSRLNRPVVPLKARK